VVDPYRGHVAASGSDTWQVDLADLAYSWTSIEVTRVTTDRVTHGRLMSSDDVATDVASDWVVWQKHVAARQTDRWRTAG
jgi:hypothetical protein